MNIIVFLWLLVWGGMFSGIYNITAGMFSSFIGFFQGSRALLPLLAVYFCLMWMFVSKIKLPSFSFSVGLFFYYCLTGLAVSFFSPAKMIALYWGGMYLAPILVIWIANSLENSLDIFRRLLLINYFIAFFVVAMLLSEAYQFGVGSKVRYQFYELPFGLGEMRSNGVGRFALLLLIVSFVRFFYVKKNTRLLWLLLIFPSIYLLFQTQSRTALLGLGVASMLFVLIKGLKWQFILAGPGSAYIIWMVGYKWRAHEKVEQLLTLTGREFTWEQALAQIKQSPFLGWGFHADRILLDSQHVHNSYIHSMIHAGLVGSLFFAGAVLGIWYLIFKGKLYKKINSAHVVDQPFLIESILILGFLTSRSFFESTAAFYGVDLLFFVPAAAYLYMWVKQSEEKSGEKSGT